MSSAYLRLLIFFLAILIMVVKVVRGDNELKIEVYTIQKGSAVFSLGILISQEEKFYRNKYRIFLPKSNLAL